MVNSSPFTSLAEVPIFAGSSSAGYIEEGTAKPRAAEENAEVSTLDMSPEMAVAMRLVERRKGLKKRFLRLVADWKKQRDTLSSSPADYAMCPAYQKIIAIGPEAVPLILEELQRHPDHWFWALHVLTDADPVPRAKRGIFKEMVRAWLEWGERSGYVFSQTAQ